MWFKILVVVIVYNEELNIKFLIECISDVLEGYDYEMVYVDDGFMDNILKELYSNGYFCLKVVELMKNYG